MDAVEHYMRAQDLIDQLPCRQQQLDAAAVHARLSEVALQAETQFRMANSTEAQETERRRWRRAFNGSRPVPE